MTGYIYHKAGPKVLKYLKTSTECPSVPGTTNVHWQTTHPPLIPAPMRSSRLFGIQVAALNYRFGVKQLKGSKPSTTHILCFLNGSLTADSLYTDHNREEDDEGNFAAVSPAPAVCQDSLIFCVYFYNLIFCVSKVLGSLLHVTQL